MKNEEGIKRVYNGFGILNLFNPFRTNGSYKLELAKYEERNVACMIMEMVKSEGVDKLTILRLNDKDILATASDFISTALPTEGILDFRFDCPEEKMNNKVRTKVVKKYIHWPDDEGE